MQSENPVPHHPRYACLYLRAAGTSKNAYNSKHNPTLASVGGAVCIPIALRMRISTGVATVSIGISVAAVAAVVAVRIVRIALTAAETTCGQGRNQDRSERHRHFSKSNRSHMLARRFAIFPMDASDSVDDATRRACASFFAALIGSAFERRSNPPSPQCHTCNWSVSPIRPRVPA